ncbi:hypothetical protein [Pseudoalteromonas piscicida]|uniref:hypothetical protein n=1 Tax=Pseudoalteromonas piscicida TaxID=43662 RepID=UPI003C7CD5CA
MSDWDDSDKFKAETIRTIIFSIAGFIVAICIIDPGKIKAAYDTHLKRENLSAILSVVDSFGKTSYSYTSASDDVIKPVPKLADLEKWYSTYGDYRSDINRLKIYIDSDVVDESISEMECVIEILGDNIESLRDKKYSNLEKTLSASKENRLWLKEWNLHLSKVSLSAVKIRDLPISEPKSCLIQPNKSSNSDAVNSAGS